MMLVVPHVFRQMIRSDRFEWFIISFDKEATVPRTAARITDFKTAFGAFKSSASVMQDPSTTNYDLLEQFCAQGLSAAWQQDRHGNKLPFSIANFQSRQFPQAWSRRALGSGLTVLGLTEDTARYASYEDLAGALRRAGKSPTGTLRELFGRMSFNILIGNTDDQARNHAAFWDGSFLKLTPAYDIDPPPRLGRDANQAMAIYGAQRASRLELALRAAPAFGLTRKVAENIVELQGEAIMENFSTIAAEAQLQDIDIDAIKGRAVLLDGIFDDLEGPLADALPRRAEVWRRRSS